MAHEWNKPYAEHIVAQAIKQAGIDDPPSLVRLARTAVFRVGNTAVKLCPLDHRPIEDVRAEADLTNLLHDRGLPVPRQLGEVFQIEDVAITISEYIEHSPDQPIDWYGLGLMVRDIHSLDVNGLGLKPKTNNDAERYQGRISVLSEKDLLNPREADYLLGVLESTQVQIAEVSGDLVLCHGDLQTGNVLRKGEKIFVVDWEKAQAAPAAVDLSKMVGRLERYGLPRHDYDNFCRGYGVRDISALGGVRGLRNLSEVGGITYLLGSPEEKHRQQARLRLSDLMSGTQSIWRDF